jgi:hypothetical protein
MHGQTALRSFDCKSRSHSEPDARLHIVSTSACPPLDPLNYERGRFIDPRMARVDGGWTWGVPDWRSLPGNKRDRFASVSMLSGTKSGSQLDLEFNGTAVGAYVIAGPDAGVADVNIDGSDFRAVNLYHRYSANLQYPRTIVFAGDLKPGRHLLRLRIDGHTASAGHAVRIMQFTAN